MYKHLAKLKFTIMKELYPHSFTHVQWIIIIIKKSNYNKINYSNYTASVSETKIVFVIVFMVKIASMPVSTIKKRSVMWTVTLSPVFSVMKLLQEKQTC